MLSDVSRAFFALGLGFTTWFGLGYLGFYSMVFGPAFGVPADYARLSTLIMGYADDYLGSKPAGHSTASMVAGGNAMEARAFNLINHAREVYGRGDLLWDERLYMLAYARSRDMSMRNYFDHVTPDGGCASTMKAEYEVTYRNVAENIGKVSSTRPLTGEVVSGIVGYWLGSRGHRFNLLYQRHTAGAVGCYGNICTFIGGNDYPGEIQLNGGNLVLTEALGAGGCHSGREAAAYWAGAADLGGEV